MQSELKIIMTNPLKIITIIVIIFSILIVIVITVRIVKKYQLGTKTLPTDYVKQK